MCELGSSNQIHIDEVWKLALETDHDCSGLFSSSKPDHRNEAVFLLILQKPGCGEAGAMDLWCFDQAKDLFVCGVPSARNESRWVLPSLIGSLLLLPLECWDSKCHHAWFDKVLGD